METHFVYVIAPVSGRSPSKIGISKNPDQRVRKLQTGHPEQLIVHHREPVPADRKRIYEQLISRDINHARVHGEWFDLNAEDATRQVQWTLIHYEGIPDLARRFRERRI